MKLLIAAGPLAKTGRKVATLSDVLCHLSEDDRSNCLCQQVSNMRRCTVRTALDTNQRVMVQLEFGDEHGFRKRYERGIRPLLYQSQSVT